MKVDNQLVESTIAMMPIPELQSNGWLPAGIHEATIAEIKERFGQIQGGDRRSHFVEKLIQYHDEAKNCSFIKFLIINGSFISNKEQPGDIDILVVLTKDFDISSQEIKPWEYNLTHRRGAMRIYRCFDLYHVTEDSFEYQKWIKLWGTDVNDKPKGMLKVIL